MSNIYAQKSMAIITPSFRGDFDRCALLAESITNLTKGVNHYIIVDSNDIDIFKKISGPNTIVVDSRELLDPWLHRFPGNSGFWWSIHTLPVRGWMTQQLRKMAITRMVSEDIIICCDSDTVFIRPFGIDNFLIDGRLGLLDVDFCDRSVVNWTKNARRLLGLPRDGSACRGHIGMLIAWDKEVLEKLTRHIEQYSRRPWQQSIAGLRTFSEYITYGVFVREVIGYQNSPHVPSSVNLVKTNWGIDLKTENSMKIFFEDISPTQIAAMVHSKDDIDPSFYRKYATLHW